MAKFIDFKVVKDAVDIADVASTLDLTKKGNQLRGECPICGGTDRSLVITPSKGMFYCFNAKTGGDVIALYAHVEEMTMRDAAEELMERYGTVQTDSTVKPTVPERSEAKETEKFQPLSYLESDHEAVIAVGFDPDEAETIGIGYAKKGMMRGTVAVPVRLSDGTLVGYIGITEAKLPTSFHLGTNVVPFKKKTA